MVSWHPSVARCKAAEAGATNVDLPWLSIRRRRARFARFHRSAKKAASMLAKVRLMRTVHPAVALFLAFATLPAYAQTCRVVSAPVTRPLVELYTSEGCSSCPPADRWLARQFPARGENASAVGLAFHVDYWDRLGWVDRFASSAYTERQYAAMRANGATFVYTPQVLLQGRDLPGWLARGPSAIDAAARLPARATIDVELKQAGDSVAVQASATIPDAALRRDAKLFIAYADSGLHSDVRAGENSGVRLSHEHVVRSLQVFGPADAQGRIVAHADVARPREAGVAPMLVAFVQRVSNGDVLQTLPVPIDACAPG
jgi:hypothetical protein